jgi:hypothetical protein
VAWVSLGHEVVLVVDVPQGLLYNGCTRVDHCYGIMKTYCSIAVSEISACALLFRHSYLLRRLSYFDIWVTDGKRKKLATSLLLQVFWNNDASMVENTVFPRLFQSVSTDLQQLGWGSKIHNSRLSYQGVWITVGKMRNFSTYFVFNTKSDSDHKGIKTEKLCELYRQDRIYLYCPILLSCHLYHCLSLSYYWVWFLS